MRIFFDQGTPAPLRKWLPLDSVTTSAEQGWADLSNGILLSAAEETGFDVLVTTDRNLQYQQNLTERKIAIAVIINPAWPVLKARAGDVAIRIQSLGPGDYEEI